MGCRRVKLCPRYNGQQQEHARLLKKELRDFKVKVSTKTGTTSAEAFNSDHDDCVMSISLPLWLGRQRWMAMTMTYDTTNLQPWEGQALEAETVAKQKREFELEPDDEEEEREDLRSMPSWGVRVNVDAWDNPLAPELWDE